MKVLLLNPPYAPDFIRSARSSGFSISGSNWYPIFLAYAAGWLKKHGHKVKLIDALVAKLSPQEVFKIAQDFKPDLLAVYISEESLRTDIAIGKKIKKFTLCQLILVGPWCAVEPEKILALDESVDAVVRREFDDALLDTANSKDKKLIKGLIYRNGGKIIVNSEREFLTSDQLDQFPFVTKIYKEHLPIDKYYQASLLHPFVDLFTGRGCVWGKCTFCLWPNTLYKDAPPYRTRKISGVIEELKYIKKELPGVREVFFQDDTLPTWRAREISEAILKKNLKLNWSCYVRANVDLETLRLMKEAGCRYLHVGYETADEAILQNISKGARPEVMKEFTENTKKAGLRVHGDFILGLPGETEETIKKTIKWAQNLGIEGYQFFLPQPYKGTPLYSLIGKKGYLTHLSQKKLNWWRFRAMKEIYFSQNYIFNTLKNINSPGDFYRLLRTAFHVVPNILKSGNFLYSSFAGLPRRAGSMRPKVSYADVNSSKRGIDDNQKVKVAWKNLWKNYRGVTKIGAWSQKKSLEKALSLVSEEGIDRRTKVIDIGCGTGRTLLSFRERSFEKSIGIDNTAESLEICQRNGLAIGKDVFLVDAKKTGFKSKEFGLVFSEGLLEHFKDPRLIIKEMARISKSYVLLIQPNHYSFYGLAIAILGNLILRNVREFSFGRDYFIKNFEKLGFFLKAEKYTPLSDFFILLFERK